MPKIPANTQHILLIIYFYESLYTSVLTCVFNIYYNADLANSSELQRIFEANLSSFILVGSYQIYEFIRNFSEFMEFVLHINNTIYRTDLNS